MANRIQLRRGIKSKLPRLVQGEPAYTTDTHEFFIGTGSGNVNMGGSQWYTGTQMSGTGSSNNYSSCPVVKVGDKYLNSSNGNMYECITAGSGSNAIWAYKGSLKGATGPAGATGAQGASGTNGANGKDGTSVVWHTGTAIEGTGTKSYSISDAHAGDMYLNTSTGDVYKASSSSSWVYQCNIKGPQGERGAQGAKGDNSSITGAASTIADTNLAADKALVSNNNGKVAVANVTATELGYLSGVKSNVQTQLDSKVGTVGTGEGSFIANGQSCTADGATSFAFGYVCKASGARSFAGGINCQASDVAAFTFGSDNTGLEAQAKFGHGATDGTKGNALSGTDGDAFFIGNGNVNAKSNAFRVAYSGDVYGKAAYHSEGADYAEFFEWADGNPENEDRTGLFVTLDGDKIRLANSNDDYILGVVSAVPGVIGNDHADTWQGMWLTDVFGRVKTQTVHHDAEYDDEGNLIHDAYDAVEPIVNPDYNPDEKYIPREKRKEWGVVGFMGQLVVIDDGTCVVNGNCTVSDGGTATASDSGYRVIARLDDTHVKVMFR